MSIPYVVCTKSYSAIRFLLTRSSGLPRLGESPSLRDPLSRAPRGRGTEHPPRRREVEANDRGVRIAKFAWPLLVFAALGLGKPALAASCADTNLRCVGSGQEYSTIQAAVSAAQPGDTVQVYAGTYAGFSTARSGTSSAPITITRNGTNSVTVTGQVQVNHNYINLNGFTLTYSNSYEGGAALRAGYSSRINHLNVSNSSIRVGGSQAFASVFYVDDLVFDSNIIEGNPSMFIAVVANGQRQTYSNNTIRNISNIERVFNVASSNTVFRGNEIYGLTWQNNDSVHPDIWQTIDDGSNSQSVIIENNYVHDSPNVQLGNMEGHSISDWTWRNNVFANMGTMYLHTGNFKFYNNTFYRSGTPNQAAVLLYNDGYGSASGAEFRNNLFVQESNTGFVGVSSGSVAWSHSNNFVANTNFTSRGGWSETGGVNGGNPQFAAVSTNCVSTQCNFRIGATSAAKDKAATLSGFAVDMVNTARPQYAAWDMGAYEYCVSPNCGSGGSSGTTGSGSTGSGSTGSGSTGSGSTGGGTTGGGSTSTGGTGTTASSVTIWQSGASQSTATDPDKASIEVGVRFRTSVAGKVTAIRFYKAPTNTGRHIAHLWTANGTLLATQTFLNESVSGWQEVKLTTPVTIPAGDYVVSYYAPVGQYASQQYYFQGKSVVSGPLTALADGTGGGNGVYVYGALRSPPIFPTSSWHASNYWVDLVFQPAS